MSHVPRKTARKVTLFSIPVLVTIAALVPGSAANSAPAGDKAAAAAGVVQEVTKPDVNLKPGTTTAAEQSVLKERVEAVRERVAGAHLAAPGSAAAAGKATAGQSTAKAKPKSAPTGRETAESEALLVRRNNQNTRASLAGSSTLVEPAAANEGNGVFYTGNTFASFSNDLGVTWTNVALPAGPADAPSACCDQDVVRAHSRDRIFSILLYTNAATTNGVVRIFVRNAPNAAASCSYTIDPGGAADNVLPDYPHIALSANFLYLGMNNITAGAWTAAQIRRFDLTQMSACGSVSTTTFNHTGTVGQRILTPVEGAQTLTVMYFAAMEATNSMRVFTWTEAAAAPTSVVRTISTSTFANPDCRGGTGNFDFIERTTSFSIAGFRMRGTVHGARVTWFWNAANDAAIPQAHVRGASFRRSDSVLLEEPAIWNASFCFGYPTVSGNSFGDLGISIAAGGAAGGGAGASAAQGYIGNDDTPADAIHFGNVSLTAVGTHNRSDGRYGDYFTVRTNARCTNTYVATNYGLNGGTAVANVNARYVEFGSTLDSACF